MALYQGKDLATWTSEINAHTVDSAIRELIEYMIPGAKYAFSDSPDSYGNLEMINKPSQSVFDDELVDWKVAEIARITAIIAELDRIEALETRLAAVDLDRAVALEGLQSTWGNKELLKKEILDNNNEALLASLETHTAAIAAEKTKIAGIEAALLAVEGGKRIVAYMNALNYAKGLTTAQVKTVLQDADLSLIKSLLESGSLVTAKEEIEAYTPDGTLVTQGDKDAIIAELTAMGV